MAEYVVYLTSGQAVKVTTDSYYWRRDTNQLIFSKNLHEVAVFNVNNICGVEERSNNSEIPSTSPDHIADDSKMATAPQDNENDTISRQAALDALHCNITISGKENAETIVKTLKDFRDKIKAMPPIWAEPKRGEWKAVKGAPQDSMYECSECGQIIYSGSRRDMREFHAYCSRCGAYMGGDATCQS